MAGYEFPTKPVTYYTRDALLFANSIGANSDELQFLYEKHPNFQIFPTFSTVLGKIISSQNFNLEYHAKHIRRLSAYKGNDNDIIDTYADKSYSDITGVPKLDLTKGVDGQKLIKIFRPYPRKSEGKSFELRKMVVGIYDKGKSGTVIETTTSLVDKNTGEVYTTEIGSVFFVGQGGWGGPKGPKPTIYAIPKDRKPDGVYSIQTTKEAALLYRLNGDYNPLHAEPGPGQRMGFAGAILHGLATWNMTCHGVLKVFGSSQAQNLKEFQARFAAPVMPGDLLVTEMWQTEYVDPDGFQEVVFQTKTGEGKVVLSNGRALVKTNAGKGARL